MPISKNLLLSALPVKSRQRVFGKLEQVNLVYGDNIYDTGDIFTHVHFIESGIVSLLVTASENATIEVAMVGNDGMSALPFFLGIEISRDRAVVQGRGTAMRMTTKDFKTECELSDDLPRVLRIFTYNVMAQIARSAVCNRFHNVESRLARWLLMTQDRMHSSEFQITQEFISYMLGVRREAVNRTAVKLQTRQLIRYVRGKVTILDRDSLVEMSCTCYTLTGETGY